MIPLQDLTDILLPKLKADGVLPAIFPTPGGKGAIVPVDDVLSALDDELEQYE